jgi:hypothetical protein
MFHSVAICLVQLGNNAKGGSNKCRQVRSKCVKNYI